MTWICSDLVCPEEERGGRGEMPIVCASSELSNKTIESDMYYPIVIFRIKMTCSLKLNLLYACQF